MASLFTVDGIAEVLEQYHQRATYKAVADYLGLPARSLMQAAPKNPRNSRIVAADSHLPTGYSNGQMHAALLERREVLSSEQDLREWLARPR